MEAVADLFGTKYDLSPSIHDIKKALRADYKNGNKIDFESLIKQESVEKKRKTMLGWLEAVASGKITIYQDLDNVTVNGYDSVEVTSALQKEIRRGNKLRASWWARELIMTEGFRGPDYCWRRMRIITVEDIGDPDIVVAFEKVYSDAKEFGLISERGARAAMYAAYLLASADRKTRFFDEVNEYFKFAFEGKIQIKNPEGKAKEGADVEELTPSGYYQRDVFQYLKDAIERKNWLWSCWCTREIMLSGKVKLQEMFWSEMIELSKHSAWAICLYAQAQQLSNKENGLGAWDSLRCAIMAAYYVSVGYKKRELEANKNEWFNICSKIELNMKEGIKIPVPDYALDGHTLRGKKMGRSWSNEVGLRHWYLVSSRVNNKVNIGGEIERDIARDVQRSWGINLTDPEFEESFQSLKIT